MQAGQATRWLPAGGAALTPSVVGLSDLPEGTKIVLGEAVVSSGSDRLGDHFFAADALGREPIEVDAPHLVPPVIQGDHVRVSGTLRHTPGGAVLDAAAVRLGGMEIASNASGSMAAQMQTGPSSSHANPGPDHH